MVTWFILLEKRRGTYFIIFWSSFWHSFSSLPFTWILEYDHFRFFCRLFAVHYQWRVIFQLIPITGSVHVLAKKWLALECGLVSGPWSDDQCNESHSSKGDSGQCYRYKSERRLRSFGCVLILTCSWRQVGELHWKGDMRATRYISKGHATRIRMDVGYKPLWVHCTYVVS